jgi:large conductance mechanosensitive channel
MAVDPTKKAFSLIEEFKAFALKGNVIDLAVGVIIGGAFGKIVESLVSKIIMPLIYLPFTFFGQPLEPGKPFGFASLEYRGVGYGAFLNEIVNFLIVAGALFIVIIKLLGALMKKKEAGPPAPTKDQELLTEIRDLLKKQAGG